VEAGARSRLHSSQGKPRLSRQPSASPRTPVPAVPAGGAWDRVLGLTVCAVIAVFPFLPDEKLNRLKLVSVQLGVLATLAAIGARAFATGRWPFSWRSDPERPMADLAAPAVAVAVWLLVNVLLALSSVDQALAMAELGRVSLAAAAFAAFFASGLSQRWRTRALFTWTSAALLIALYASLQRRGALGPIEVPKMDRAIATFGNPIFLSAYLVLSALVATAAIRKATSEGARFFGVSAVVLIVAAIAATGTRSAYVGLASAAMLSVFLVGSRDRKRIAVSALAAVALAGFLLYPLLHRDQAHLLIWRDTLRLVAAHPFAGVGLGAFHVHFPAVAQADLIAKWPKGSFVVNYAHNEYLQALAEGGPVLASTFLTIFVSFLLVVRTRARAPQTPRSVVPLALGVVAVAVQNFFSVDMRFSVSLASTFMVMGLAMSDSERRPMWVAPALTRWPAGARVAVAAVWVALTGVIAQRFVITPFLQQRAAAETADFFDERLLEPARTINDLETLSTRYPTESAIMEKLGYAYAKEMKSVDGKVDADMTAKAIGAYQRVLEADPARVSAHNNLGNIFYTAGRADEAEAGWRRAAELEPAFLDPRLNLGKVLYVRGDLKEASAWFQSVLKIQPGHPEALLYLRRMVE